MTTDTPDKGAPCSLVTLPVTVFCCETAWGATQSIPSNAMTTPFFIMRPAGVGSMGPDVTARSCRPQDAKAWRAHPAGPTLPHGFARFETAERCRDRPAARRRHRHRLEPLRHRARRRPRAVRRVRPGAAMAGAPHAGAARRPARRRARPFPYSRARGLVRGARGRAGAADRRQRGAQPDPRPLGPAPDRRRGPGPAHRRPGRAGGVVDRLLGVRVDRHRHTARPEPEDLVIRPVLPAAPARANLGSRATVHTLLIHARREVAPALLQRETTDDIRHRPDRGR